MFTFTYREPNPSILGESQVSQPLDHGGLDDDDLLFIVKCPQLSKSCQI